MGVAGGESGECEGEVGEGGGEGGEDAGCGLGRGGGNSLISWKSFYSRWVCGRVFETRGK